MPPLKAPYLAALISSRLFPYRKSSSITSFSADLSKVCGLFELIKITKLKISPVLLRFPTAKFPSIFKPQTMANAHEIDCQAFCGFYKFQQAVSKVFRK